LNMASMAAEYAAAQAAHNAPLIAAAQAVAAADKARVDAAQAALDATLPEQAAAMANAQAAQLQYADALQDFAIDAGKSVSKLADLREETVRYYEAQKQL